MSEGIRYFGNFQETGVGYAARGYIQVLKALGYGSDLVRAVTVFGEFTDIPALRPYVSNPHHDDVKWTTQIVHTNPIEAHRYASTEDDDVKRNILITFWETDSLPKLPVELKLPMGMTKKVDVIESLKVFDEIWVPTTFVQRTFEKAGLKARVVPHVIPDEFLANIEDISQKPIMSKTCRFYNVGTWDARKNPAALIRAYVNTKWTHADNVGLFMHLLPADRSRLAINNHAREISRALTHVCKQEELPPFSMSTIPQSIKRIVSMHRGGDVFITPSRGEAFCYDAVIAAAYGNVVVGGGGPALEDLKKVSPDNVMLLPYEVKPVVTDPTYPWFDIDQNWYATSVKQLKDALMEAKASLRSLKLETHTPAMRYYTARNIAKTYLEGWTI